MCHERIIRPVELAINIPSALAGLSQFLINEGRELDLTEGKIVVRRCKEGSNEMYYVDPETGERIFIENNPKD